MSQPTVLDALRKPQVQRRTGIGLLFLVGGACLLANLVAIYLLGYISTLELGEAAFFALNLGLVLAQPFILLIWLILGTGSIWQRLSTCAGLFMAILSIGFLGFSFFVMDEGRTVLGQLRRLILESPILFAPVFIWGGSLPLLAYHLLLGRRFQWQATSPDRAVITIRGILLFTTMTALVLASLQVVNLTLPDLPNWWIAGIGSGIAMLFSLLFVVTAVGRLMRERGFWLWACLWPTALILVTTIIFLPVQTDGFRRPLDARALDAVLLVDVVPFSFAVAIVTCLGALRLLGFRICRP
ncbi:MAG: hypothetical protein MK108_04750 [Mariniblastus sp.]|nr:hypothetical protein [Mariniblastus sp.]